MVEYVAGIARGPQYRGRRCRATVKNVRMTVRVKGSAARVLMLAVRIL
jgi:hypothetical protein